MPSERGGLSHKIEILDHAGTQEGYVTANVDENGDLREVFLTGFAKEGSAFSGWISGVVPILLSVALQSGVELATISRKLVGMNFEPRGKTSNPDIPECSSIPDYIARWLVSEFGDDALKTEFGLGV